VHLENEFRLWEQQFTSSIRLGAINCLLRHVQTQPDNKMKLTKILTALALAVAMTGSILAADGKIKEGGCCDKAKKAGKECAHPCCVAAAKEGKVCEKCNK
jgi:hypothetical protein